MYLWISSPIRIQDKLNVECERVAGKRNGNLIIFAVNFEDVCQRVKLFGSSGEGLKCFASFCKAILGVWKIFKIFYNIVLQVEKILEAFLRF